MESLLFSTFGLGLAFCAAPGAVNAEALRRGLLRGFWPALLVQLGSLIGDTLWAALALTGTAFLLQNEPLRLVLGIAGGCFLLRLAYSALRDAWRAAPGASESTSRGAFAAGAFFSLTNPSALVFWLGIGGGIIGAAHTHVRPATLFAFFGGFECGAIAWCVTSSALIAWGRRFAGAAFFRWVNAACGAALGYLGVRVVWRTLAGLRLARLFLG